MRQHFLDLFYKCLSTLRNNIAANVALYPNSVNGYHFLKDRIPQEFITGVYFHFENEIFREDGKTLKVMRVGKTGNNNNNRLQNHSLNDHLNSVFRRHVGFAIINCFRINQFFDWNSNYNLPDNDYVELSVSLFIRHMPYLFLPVEGKNDRETIEKGAIGLLSNSVNVPAIDVPPATWLGYSSESNAIRNSHLWNVQHTEDDLNETRCNQLIQAMQHYIDLV